MKEFHYEEVSLEEMIVEDGVMTFPCPCGDLFELTVEEFSAGAEVARCPTCSLTIRVLATAEQRALFLSRHRSGAAPGAPEVLSA